MLRAEDHLKIFCIFLKEKLVQIKDNVSKAWRMCKKLIMQKKFAKMLKVF